jgi:hypothetical protein
VVSTSNAVKTLIEIRAIGDDGVGLRGTLETFALTDVLRLLAMTRKSGCLTVEGDLGRGIVRFCRGALVEASVDRPLLGEWTLAEVIFEMLRFKRGSFGFAAEAHPVAVNGQPDEIETTIAQATQLLKEWLELEAVVPSLNHRVALASELPEKDVTIDTDTWAVLATITHRPTVLEVACRLELNELDAMRAISHLVALGVAVVEPTSLVQVPWLVTCPEGTERGEMLAHS